MRTATEQEQKRAIEVCFPKAGSC
ncbi:hypothetical protein NTGM5_880013 [Candidatus Nitrotoga sp. M5]|nr:hypothetical protein NTGM5_880013 [Candidatus Nitrotoga sp. M5]